MNEKKRQKIKEKIGGLETLLKESLKKKSHNTGEIDVARVQRQIEELRKQLAT